MTLLVKYFGQDYGEISLFNQSFIQFLSSRSVIGFDPIIRQHSLFTLVASPSSDFVLKSPLRPGFEPSFLSYARGSHLRERHQGRGP